MLNVRSCRCVPIFLAVAIAILLATTMPGRAHAATVADDQDLLLGVFNNSEKDWTNSFYASTDGKVLHRIGTTYDQTDATNHTYGGGHYPQYDPSIMYYDGYFWSLSGWNRQDDKIWVMISYSKDLVHWTHPEGESLLVDSTKGIMYETKPAHSIPGRPNCYDTVAPEWFVNKDGKVYIIVSCGYYGAFHGDATHDYMQAYVIKVNQLSAGDGDNDANSSYLWPHNLTFKAGPARRLTFSSAADANFIDGAGFAEGNYDYIVIKKDGLTNQVYRTTNMDEPSSWELVNSKATPGFGGASIAKLGDTYYLYADHVTGATADGVQVATATSIDQSGPWTNPVRPVLMTESNNGSLTACHGTVMMLKAGTPEWRIVKDLYERRVADVKPGTMWRLYNPNSGEHFYTLDVVERNDVVAVGWTFEGIAWRVPEISDTPVYRLYSGTDHQYTADKAERDWLINTIGWQDEGIGWYSNDVLGVPVYRQYNPNVNPSASKNNSGSHNYTTSLDEHSFLVALGWEGEGVAWYGLRDEESLER